MPLQLDVEPVANTRLISARAASPSAVRPAANSGSQGPSVPPDRAIRPSAWASTRDHGTWGASLGSISRKAADDSSHRLR